jgi:hypothetical protein
MIEKKRIQLDEVTLMRTILAVIIVFMHSFTCYQGAWTKPEGCIDIPAYKWIARIAFAFTLETFVFISGYLFAFQSITLNKSDGWKVIINKLKRLILPGIIFSSAYFIIFYEYKGVGNFLYNIVNGCGHLWFLPMLFWCFVGAVILQKIKIGDGWKLLFLVLINLFWPLTLPFQLSTTTNYIFYFYLGYVVYKHSERIKEFITPKNLVISWMLFIVVFVLFRPLKETIVIGDQDIRLYKLLSSSARSACQLIYATIGTLTFYMTMVYCTRGKQLSKFTISLASCCFGIYLIHQFILMWLYYNTNFAILVGAYLMPWLGFAIVLTISYLLSFLLLKNKLGKLLIG